MALGGMGGPEWRTRLVACLIGGLVIAVLLILALVYATDALFFAYRGATGDRGAAAAATAGTLLAVALFVWLAVRLVQSGGGRAAVPSPEPARPDLLEEGLELARHHPILATLGALAAGFAASRSTAADRLLSSLVERQIRGERRPPR